MNGSEGMLYYAYDSLLAQLDFHESSKSQGHKS